MRRGQSRCPGTHDNRYRTGLGRLIAELAVQVAPPALRSPIHDRATMAVARHSAITGAQMTGYRAFAQTGAPLTWEAVSTIETNALVRGGMAPNMARATVTKAIDALMQAGVAGPTRIPWGR